MTFRCESVKKLCTRVKHLQRFQLRQIFFFFQYCSWWLWYPCRSPIFDGDGLSTEGSCVLKTTDVSWYMVVYHIVVVLYMWMGSHMTLANSINWGGYFVLLYLSQICIYLKNQRVIDIHLAHIWPLCTQHCALTIMKITDTGESIESPPPTQITWNPKARISRITHDLIQ